MLFDKSVFCLIVTAEEWDVRQATEIRKSPGEKTVKDIKRANRKDYSPKRLP